MASEEELEKLRARRMAQIQSQQQQQQDVDRAQQEADAQKQNILRKILTPEARQRLQYDRLVRPEFSQQLELQLIQLVQAGRVQIPIDDELLKKLLTQIQNQQTKRDISIRRV